MRVEAWLPRAAAAQPRRAAVGELSYETLLGAARRGADELREAGVEPGARVAIRIAPGATFAAALHACLLLGSVAVPVDPRLSEAEADPIVAGAVAHVDESQPQNWMSLGRSGLGGVHPPGEETHDLDAPAIVVHTSGTSADPKPVELTYGNWLWSALGSAAALGVDIDERWLCCLPLAHVGGLSILMRSAIYATTAIVHERFETGRVLEALDEPEGPTLVSLVPTTLSRLLDAGLSHPPALRWALLGGAAIPDSLLDRAAQAGVPVAPTYGMTESCSQVVTLGSPLFCTRVDVADDGELFVSGPTVAPASGPRLATGDVGSVDASGRITVTGRKADTIITGGENVAPQEVEDVLCSHPAVAEALVHGRADRQWGEALVARVVLRPGALITGYDLSEFCARRLAAFKVPKEVLFVTTLPRTPSGKLARRNLES